MFNIDNTFISFDEPLNDWFKDEINLHFERDRRTFKNEKNKALEGFIDYKNYNHFFYSNDCYDDFVVDIARAGVECDNGKFIMPYKSWFMTTLKNDYIREINITITDNFFVALGVAFTAGNNYYFVSIFTFYRDKNNNICAVSDLSKNPVGAWENYNYSNGNIAFDCGNEKYYKTILHKPEYYFKEIFKKYPVLKDYEHKSAVYFYQTIFNSKKIIKGDSYSQNNYDNYLNNGKELIKRAYDKEIINNPYSINRKFKNKLNFAFERISFLQLPPKRVIIKDFNE